MAGSSLIDPGRGRVSFRWLGNAAETVTSSRLIGPGTTTTTTTTPVRISAFVFPPHPALFRRSTKHNPYATLYTPSDGRLSKTVGLICNGKPVTAQTRIGQPRDEPGERHVRDMFFQFKHGSPFTRFHLRRTSRN